MKLFKCLVPVLVLLLVEGSSATLCLLLQFLPFHAETSLLHRMCHREPKQQYRTSAPPTVNRTVNNFEHGATQLNGDGTAINIGTINSKSSDQGLFPTNDAREIADRRSKVNHIPNQGTVPEQSGQPGQWIIVPFEAPNAGGGAGSSTFGGYRPAYGSRVPGANSASNAVANARSSFVGGFGGNAGNNGIISGGSASSGTNGGSFGANAKADAVPTAGSDGSIAYRQGSSGGLSRAISIANSNASGGSGSSSSKSTANGSGVKSSAISYASASAGANV